MELIHKYFPKLDEQQVDRFERLKGLYEEWNAKINVISRKDMDQFYLHHVLHSLAIAKLIQFPDGAHVVDIGTGGGFPGIPLAIFFPEVQFTLADSIRKKITVVENVSSSLDLNNVKCQWTRAEDLKGKYDYVVTRAVKPMPMMMSWMKGKITRTKQGDPPNGYIALKGGDLVEELSDIKNYIRIELINQWYKEDWFEGKKIVWVEL